ncbi:hypothetical protein [Bacillus dakarensis]|uniref:hypothetical protein n=1 Tax=Robertmurraya dakarensis TaxID=1926278 RepID=UPI0011156761|nr:hypothetical protein [Bacillus dakarensis]
MMMNKKLLGYALTGALSIGIIGGIGTSAFAATSLENSTVNQSEQSLDAETQEKVQKIKEELRAQLSNLGVNLPERGEKGKLFANLDEATKEKAEALFEQQKAGTITHEEAEAQLEELGVTFRERVGKDNPFATLDEATKEKADAIFEQQKAGTITREEAKAQLEELGVTFPERGNKGKKADPLANLDEETKAKAQELIDHAKAELEELGVKHAKF